LLKPDTGNPIQEINKLYHKKSFRLLAPLTVTDSPKKTTARLNRNSKVFKTIIKAIQDKKGEHILSLDLRKIPEAVADFFIICQATSNTQVRAISDNVEDELYQVCGERPYKHEGKTLAHWVLIDYISIVVHVMQPDARKFYKLEDMWSDAVVTGHDL
jgi:ribosome-associated protein